MPSDAVRIREASRTHADRRYVQHAAVGVQWRLMDNADARLAQVYLDLAERYKTLYQFTQEEIDGSSA